MGARKLVTLFVLAAAVVLTARYLFWNDARDVRRRLHAMAEAASVDGTETSADTASIAAKLNGFLADDVIIRTDSAAFVGGRPAVERMVLDAAAARRQMRVTAEDVQVEIVDRSTATVFLTLKIAGGDPHAVHPPPKQVHATLIKQDGRWLLARGEVLRTLE
jgi:ketosteroid isomerase-like protein